MDKEIGHVCGKGLFYFIAVAVLEPSKTGRQQQGPEHTGSTHAQHRLLTPWFCIC